MIEGMIIPLGRKLSGCWTKTKNLLASKEETVIDFIKYLIENRISADKVRATI